MHVVSVVCVSMTVVPGTLLGLTPLTKKGHKPKTEHIERSDAGGNQAYGPENLVGVRARQRLPKNLVLIEEPRKMGQARRPDRPEGHGTKANRKFLTQADRRANTDLAPLAVIP